MAYSDEYDYPFQQFSFNVVGSEDGFMGWGFDNLTFELSAPFDHFQTQCFCQIDPQISLIAIDEVFISPIPEPETYALMLAGLAVVGAAAKRRRAQ